MSTENIAIPALPDTGTPRVRTAMLWMAAIIALVVLPLVFPGGLALTIFCQIGIMAIFALAYNTLLGGTGLLSFGHAAYFGIGAFATMHLLLAVERGVLVFPVTLAPAIGGAAAALFAFVFGYVSVKRAGTAFAMITLGLAELVHAASLTFPQVFGGEGGISGNRVVGPAGWFGIDYASQRQVYYLIVGWAVVAALSLRFLADTPLGRIASAVRDNSERVEFVGYDIRRVRFAMLIVSAFFSGVAGGLLSLSYERVTINLLEMGQSSAVLMMTFVGGSGHFLGPVLGAAALTVMQSLMANYTQAWLFYFGLLFLLVVLFAPNGIAGLIESFVRSVRGGRLLTMAPWYLAMLVPLALLCASVVGAVELGYSCLSRADCADAAPRIAGWILRTDSPLTWAVLLSGTVAGIAGLRVPVFLETLA